jgi:DNA-binding NarL/FixJ family response regulator
MNAIAHILLVDDHAMFVEPVAALLQQENYQTTVTTSSSEALTLLQNNHFDIALVDLAFSNQALNGLDLLSVLAQKGIPTLVMSGVAELEDIRAAVKLGAKGFIPKAHAIPQLLQATQGVLAGLSYFADGLLDSLFSGVGSIPRLAPRVQSVLAYMMRHPFCDNYEISDALHVSVSRVKSCLTELYYQYQVSGRHELVSEAKRRGYYPALNPALAAAA